MTSSPITSNFSTSASSAFSAVSTAHASVALPPQPVRSGSPERRATSDPSGTLRTSSDHSRASLTPKKSSVPKVIASLERMSSVPFYRAKSSPCCSSLSPIKASVKMENDQPRNNKRAFQPTTSFHNISPKRSKPSDSICDGEQIPFNRMMAFASKSRKTKSTQGTDDCRVPPCFRPISAPAQMVRNRLFNTYLLVLICYYLKI